MFGNVVFPAQCYMPALEPNAALQSYITPYTY